MHRGGDYGNNDFVDTELRAQGEAIEVFTSPIFSLMVPHTWPGAWPTRVEVMAPVRARMTKSWNCFRRRRRATSTLICSGAETQTGFPSLIVTSKQR